MLHFIKNIRLQVHEANILKIKKYWLSNVKLQRNKQDLSIFMFCLTAERSSFHKFYFWNSVRYNLLYNSNHILFNLPHLIKYLSPKLFLFTILILFQIFIKMNRPNAVIND